MAETAVADRPEAVQDRRGRHRRDPEPDQGVPGLLGPPEEDARSTPWTCKSAGARSSASSGPNGSGKTTTIKLLLGLLFPTKGEATVFGMPAADVRKNERIGYLPEESYLYRFLNAEETLDFYGRLFDMPADVRRRRAADLIRLVGLEQDRRRTLREYSKGMRQRIGLAQALINDPEFIILDEPTSGLDPNGTIWMKDLIRRAARPGQDGPDVHAPAGRRAGRLRPDRHPVQRRPAGDRGRWTPWSRTPTASRCGPSTCG